MADKVLMKGNEAIAEAAIMAGCRHYFGYPITPQTEVAAYMAKRMPKIGGVFLQAESEIAAINMVYGVSSTGHRVMTSSSSPGISLKSEGLSYLAGADSAGAGGERAAGRPGAGGHSALSIGLLPGHQGRRTRGFPDHVLAPASVQEMADLTMKGFDLADEYRMTAMILADGTMGQMMEPVEIPKIEKKEFDKSWAVTGTGMGRKHNIVNSLSLAPAELERQNFERFQRYGRIQEKEAMWEEYRMEDAEYCLVAFGIAARVTKAAIDEARKKGIRAGMIRPITLWPFPEKALAAAAEKCVSFATVELNMGQMIDDVRLAISCKRPVKLIHRAGGIIPSPEEVLRGIENMEGGAEK